MVHPILSSPTLQRLTAWGMVIALHCLCGTWLLARHAFMPPPSDEQRLRLRWLPAEPRPMPTTPATAPARPSSIARSRTTATAATRPLPIPATTDDDALPPLDLGVPTTVAGGEEINAATFAPRIIGRRGNNPAFEHAPRYFRLNPRHSPKEMIESIGKAVGLWPAGYEVDPCRLSRSDINYFQNAVSELDRQALKEALLSANAHCRQ